MFRSLMATVELIQNNAKDLGELQRKMDSWHGQGLDEREIMARSKDEQLRSKQKYIAVKIVNIGTPVNIAVIILKFEQGS